MTWTVEDDAPAPETAGAARSVRIRRLRRTLASALVGALLLGAAGAVVGATRTAAVSASALVQSSPDPNAVEQAASGTTAGDPAARNATYLETELVYLTGEQLAARVGAEVGGVVPELNATRVGSSNVLQITSTAATSGSAIAQTQSAADLYVQDRQQRLSRRIADQTAALDAQIAATGRALDGLPSPNGTTGFDAQAQQRSALSAQYADQLSARDALQRAAADVSSIAGVVQSATAEPGGAVSTVVLLALAGAVLGALLGAAMPALASSVGGRLRDEKDVADLGVPLLSPPLPRAAGSEHRGGPLDRAVQLQALALRTGPAGGGSVAFLGGASGTGTSFAALQHARHAARYRPVLLISALGESDDELARLGVDTSRNDFAELAPEPGTSISWAALLPVAQPTIVPNLFVLVAGPGDEQQFSSTVRALAGEPVAAATAAGWGVVVDSAPLDQSDIGLILARQCAETVVVAGIRQSRIDELERTMAVLRSAGVPLSGVVVTHPVRRLRERWAAPDRTSLPAVMDDDRPRPTVTDPLDAASDAEQPSDSVVAEPVAAETPAAGSPDRGAERAGQSVGPGGGATAGKQARRA